MNTMMTLDQISRSLPDGWFWEVAQDVQSRMWTAKAHCRNSPTIAASALNEREARYLVFVQVKELES